MPAYCENCGTELSSLFCETCGTISSNLPNSFSTDDSLAGLLANALQNGKTLMFSEVYRLTKSSDRTHRIFSQLEKTKKYLILKQKDDYLLTAIPNTNKANTNTPAITTENKLVIIKSLLEIFPLTKEDIISLFPLQVDFKEFIKFLGPKYELKLEKNKEFVHRKS